MVVLLFSVHDPYHFEFTPLLKKRSFAENYKLDWDPIMEILSTHHSFYFGNKFCTNQKSNKRKRTPFVRNKNIIHFPDP